MTSTRQILNILENFEFTQNLEKDVAQILRDFNKQKTFIHLKAVTQKALEIADNYSVDKDSVYKAAILHDISAIIPNDLRIVFSERIGVEDIHQDDRDNPIMLHGKISAEIARKYFNVSNEETLNAMRYHTTLRANATTVEQIIFIADKIALDTTSTHDAEYMKDALTIVNEDVTKAC